VGEGWFVDRARFDASLLDGAATLDPPTPAGIVSALCSGREVADVVMRTRDGDELATTEPDRNVRLRFAQYLVDRASYYAMEGRWPESPFWRRRRTLAA
jgi:hypothetical protein